MIFSFFSRLFPLFHPFHAKQYEFMIHQIVVINMENIFFLLFCVCMILCQEFCINIYEIVCLYLILLRFLKSIFFLLFCVFSIIYPHIQASAVIDMNIVLSDCCETSPCAVHYSALCNASMNYLSNTPYLSYIKEMNEWLIKSNHKSWR